MFQPKGIDRMGNEGSRIMKQINYNRTLKELREKDHQLQHLEERSRKLPPDKRTGIDTKSEELEEEKKFIVLMLDHLDQERGESSRELGGKVREAISQFSEEIENIADMIKRAHENQ